MIKLILGGKNNMQIKILMGDNTPEYGVNIANKLRNYGFYIYTRKKDGNIILDSIVKENPDIVIIDTAMINIDAISLIKRVKRNNEHSPIFIVTSLFENEFVEKQLMANGASYFILRPFNCDDLCEIINAIIQDNEQESNTNIETVVTEIIHQIGIPANIKGYSYLRTGIISAIENRNILDSITKVLYPTIAEMHNTTAIRVERAMRHAINSAWKKGNFQVVLNNFFGYQIASFKHKPSNSEFIALITDNLRLRLKYSSNLM